MGTQYQLPSVEAAINLLRSLGAPPRLIRHSEIVAGLAGLLSDVLTDLGVTHVTEQVEIGAALHDAGKIIHSDEMDGTGNLHEMLGYLIERPRPLGMGIPAVLALSTGRQGWRTADYWLHEAPFQTKSEYDDFPFYWGNIR